MSNDYFNATGAPGSGSQVSSAVLRSEYQNIEAGFDKVAPLAGKSNLPIFVNATASGQEAISIAAAKGLLGIPTAYVHPNHTGDVTSTGDGATVIANTAVTLGKLSAAVQSTLGTIKPNAISAAVAGKSLNVILATIIDGTDVNTVAAYTIALLGSASITGEDNLAKSGSTTSFTLSAGGSLLEIKAAALVAAATHIVAYSFQQNYGTAIQGSVSPSAGKLQINIADAATGANIDLTAALTAPAHRIDVLIAYLSD